MIVLSHVTEEIWSWLILKIKIEISCRAKFYVAIQGVPEGKVNTLEGCSMSHCAGKRVHMNTWLIVKADRASNIFFTHVDWIMIFTGRIL